VGGQQRGVLGCALNQFEDDLTLLVCSSRVMVEPFCTTIVAGVWPGPRLRVEGGRHVLQAKAAHAGAGL
jgi:hypothetical protein